MKTIIPEIEHKNIKHCLDMIHDRATSSKVHWDHEDFELIKSEAEYIREYLSRLDEALKRLDEVF